MLAIVCISYHLGSRDRVIANLEQKIEKKKSFFDC